MENRETPIGNGVAGWFVAGNLTMQQILGYAYLTTLVEEIKTGIPNVLPGVFYSTKSDIFADTVRHIRTDGTRQVSRQSLYGSPPRHFNLIGLGQEDVKLVHTIEDVQIPIREFLALREHENYNVQQLGLQEIARQAQQFKARFDNHRIAAATSVLANGNIWYDVNGNILPTSSGAALTINFGIPPLNTGTINSIIGTSWATSSATIPKDILSIKDYALQVSGYALEGGLALYDKTIPDYFAGNTLMQNFMWRNPGYQQKFLDSGEIPNGFMNFSWHRMSGAFFQDQNGTNQTMWPTDQITFCPPIEKMLWDFVQGSYPVPTVYGIMSSLEAAAESFAFRYGMFSYAYPIWVPPTATLVYGDTFLPWMKVPGAFFQAATTA